MIMHKIQYYDGSLSVCFDRDLSFKVGGDLGADIVPFLRLVILRSNEKLGDSGRFTSKKSMKLSVVESAMHSIGRDAAPLSKPTVSKPDKFLNNGD